MSKVPLLPVASIDNSLVNNVNTNSNTITTAFDNTLSRNGQSPNQMQSVLDMNSNPIINIPFATMSNQPVALGQLTNNVSPIQQLTGDVTGAISLPSGVVPTTIATVNSNVGTFGSSTQVPVVTVNAKGQTTAVTTANINTTNISNSQLAQMAADTIKGNNTGVSATPLDLTQAQVTALLNLFTSSLQGLVPASGGGTTNFLRADGTWNPLSTITTPTVQTFTSGSATYTPTAGTVFIKVRIVGGGGGGGASTTNAGTAGGTTTFGSWTAIGGAAGQPAQIAATGAGPLGGSGGVNGTGTLIVRVAGQRGGMAWSSSTSVWNGGGGSSPLGGGTGTMGDGGAGVPPAVNTGSGGSGGGTFGSNSGSGGGAGEYVEFFVNSPGATSYTVGTAGSGGAAGGSAGGNGAAGVIIIEEYPF